MRTLSMRERKRRTVRWVKIGAGWFLLALGVAGLFLPFIQGLLCIAVGLTVLSSEYEWARVWLVRVKRRLRMDDKAKKPKPWSALPNAIAVSPGVRDDPSLEKP